MRSKSRAESAVELQTTVIPAKKDSWRKDFRQNWPVYALFIPVAAFFIIFSYVPMFGILISFQNYKPQRGIFGSEWVGLQNFADLFSGGVLVA